MVRSWWSTQNSRFLFRSNFHPWLQLIWNLSKQSTPGRPAVFNYNIWAELQKMSQLQFLSQTPIFEPKNNVWLEVLYMSQKLINWPTLTLRRPMRRKLRMRWFFYVFKVKDSSFFKIGPHLGGQSDFWCASFGKYSWVRWFYSLFERMRLKKKKNDFYSH